MDTQVSMKSKENMDSLKQELEEEMNEIKIGWKRARKKRANETMTEIKSLLTVNSSTLKMRHQ